MYEPIRAPSSRRGSVHSTMAATTTSDFPHRSREEELDIQLAGHLAALLAVTDELRSLAPSDDLNTAADRLAEQVTRLRGGGTPVHAVASGEGAGDGRTLHERAHTLAGRALVVAASRADTAVAILSAERMDAHADALAEPQELTSVG